MTIYEIITKKKHGAELSEAEINWVVEGYTLGRIPDYQMSALLMAVCFCSMSDAETACLTMAMARSGDMIKPDTGGFNVDKHSTGGVGDKTTLISAPIAAACGGSYLKCRVGDLGIREVLLTSLNQYPVFARSLRTAGLRKSCVKRVLRWRGRAEVLFLPTKRYMRCGMPRLRSTAYPSFVRR